MLSESDSISLGEVLGENSDQRLAWDNAVKFHLSRHLLLLRKFRGWSQSKVAKLAQTSQSYLARVESGDENITADSAERLINALEGRFSVSVAPKEMHLPEWRPWWELADAGIVSASPFSLVGVKIVGIGGVGSQILGGLWTTVSTSDAISELSALGTLRPSESLESHGEENRS